MPEFLKKSYIWKFWLTKNNTNNIKQRNERKRENSYSVLIKDITQTVENGTKEQRDGFLGMLWCRLGSILLENTLTDEGVIATRKGKGGVVRATEEATRQARGDVVRASNGASRTGQRF